MQVSEEDAQSGEIVNGADKEISSELLDFKFAGDVSLGFTRKEFRLALPEGDTSAYEYYVHSSGIKRLKNGKTMVRVHGEAVGKTPLKSPKPYTLWFKPRGTEAILLLIKHERRCGNNGSCPYPNEHKGDVDVFKRAAWVSSNGMGNNVLAREALFEAAVRFGHAYSSLVTGVVVDGHSLEEQDSVLKKFLKLW